ncbi:sugar ABC transporter substrate-binding protein [Psychromonas marina]|uniref:Probable sugar-binding periplasmic protein n=1 Tax=Psychromonas marina TaxID=88364 RepID=A0ABQ6DZ79_9GAMM|nr:ABC transporter substrate-binding protein [Psychromonas marina]GLS90240.1 sugar ABC transporter substrate-binding protein [Psychromonas marina]
MKMIKIKKFLLLWPFLYSAQSYADPLEVLHWWTESGEFEAQAILDEALKKQDITWENFAIVGSGGGSALRVLQMRALSANPPDVAQIKGPDIGEWAQMGMLKEVDSIIGETAWHQYIPEIVKNTIRYEDSYMALPLNIHRVNWLWLNKAIFDELNLVPPTTWEGFFEVADKIQQAGYIALAHGSTSWQDSLLFESVALSLLGAEKYKQAFVQFDENVLASQQMIDVFEQFKRLKKYTGNDMRGKNWVVASKMISDKKAGMLFMGDWSKGMWHAEGKAAMKDYLCVEVPGTHDVFSYNIDSFVFFKKLNSASVNVNTQTFAKTILSKDFQRDFNIQKGSMPVRTDMDMTDFDACTQKAYQDFNRSDLVPSLSQNIATTSYLQSEISKIISYYFKNDDMTAKQAVRQLALAIRAVNK